jgi:hypothetical protein
MFSFPWGRRPSLPAKIGASPSPFRNGCLICGRIFCMFLSLVPFHGQARLPITAAALTSP